VGEAVAKERVIRASLLKQPLAPDFETQWKFDGATK
jgi:hypothetical protein